MNWLADKIEQWPTAKVLPYACNARTHSEEQVAQIAASHRRVRLHQSDPRGQRRHHRRWPRSSGRRPETRAGDRAGGRARPLEPHPTPALVIADNRIAENAGWDEAMLQDRTEARCSSDGFDLDITGFDADALAELIAGDEPQRRRDR